MKGGGVTVACPGDLRPGDHISVVRPKSAGQRNYYVVVDRDGAGWLMTNGSRIPDDAPCYRDGRMTLVKR